VVAGEPAQVRGQGSFDVVQLAGEVGELAENVRSAAGPNCEVVKTWDDQGAAGDREHHPDQSHRRTSPPRPVPARARGPPWQRRRTPGG
jgi:hypothetical protein